MTSFRLLSRWGSGRAAPLLALGLAALAACSIATDPGTTTGSGGFGAGVHTSATGAGGIALGGGGTGTGPDSGPPVPCNEDPNVDGDGDGFSPAEGDCDDCNAAVNPGAVDVVVTGDAGEPVPVDQNCDGQASPPSPCDDGLAVDDADPVHAARAIELCDMAPITPATPEERRFGLKAARWVSASGAEPRDPGLQAGLLEGFGPHVVPHAGKRVLALSTGRARLPEQAGACGGANCTTRSNVDPPEGFPQVVPGCDGGTIINDDVALEVDLRAPTNATGFSFALKFHSFEYPAWVCTPYNDQFIALVHPEPQGSIKGNIAFDALKNPVSVNFAAAAVCDPGTISEFAQNCADGCPAPPNPYCPAGPEELAGTGFDVWGDAAGATRWLRTTSPVGGGSEITVRFTIWDTTDQALDSTVLLDDFAWITAGAVTVATTPAQ